MSHFTGLVILTPEYVKEHTLEDALSKYDEKIKTEPYVSGVVDDYDKITFLSYYNEKTIGDTKSLAKQFYDDCHNKEGFFTKAQLAEEWGRKEEDIDDTKYIEATPYWNKEFYVNWFKTIFPEVFEKFTECYEKNGDDWNCNCWKLNKETGIWEEWSTYNPDSVYDWYSLGGRWSQSIKTKSGEFVNECFLDEIDWSPFKPEDYCKKAEKNWKGEKYYPLKKSVKWHFTKDNPPYCLFVDGEHISKGKMGWWAISTDEKEDWNEQVQNILKKIDGKSLVCLMDFHI